MQQVHSLHWAEIHQKDLSTNTCLKGKLVISYSISDFRYARFELFLEHIQGEKHGFIKRRKE